MFITVEGIDGSGKTTLCKLLKEELPKQAKARGIRFFSEGQIKTTREPGATKVGAKIREIVLHDEMCYETEFLLMMADRMEHLDKFIVPNLSAGSLVISDRYIFSTFAYQCGGKGLNQCAVSAFMTDLSVLMPNLVIYLDVPLSASKSRLPKSLDKFESKEECFYVNVKSMYERVLFDEKDDELWDFTSVRRIDASKDQPAVLRAAVDAILDFYENTELPNQRLWRKSGYKHDLRNTDAFTTGVGL